MRRFTATTLVLTLIVSAMLATNASAYTGCEKYRYGSHDWWFCVSDEDGER